MSATAGTTTGWAVLPMGDLADPLNTFWQLFYLSGSSPRWQLSTPPGVASNGGLAVSTPVSLPDRVLAGFGPSQDLRFSPLALTSDGGRSWLPGVLPGALPRVPDALAASGTNRDLALQSGGGGGTLSGGVVAGNSAGLAVWTSLVSTRALASEPASASCGIVRLTAVAYAAGNPAVAAACARGGRPGIFSEVGGHWASVGPSIPGVKGGPTEVLRLVDTAAGTAALVSVGAGSTTRLIALWSAAGPAGWTISGGLSLDGHHLVATGVTPAGGFVVTSQSTGGQRSASVIEPSAGPWRVLATPPPGTALVAATPSTGFDALVADKSTLAVYALGNDGWSRIQKLSVPIQYGSSG